jgi:O-antigen/teichoic acid export membrane protein
MASAAVGSAGMRNNWTSEQDEHALKRTLRNVFWVSIFVIGAGLLGIALFSILWSAPPWSAVIITLLLVLIAFINEVLKRSHRGI